MIKSDGHGYLCGYVRIPSNHPLYKRHHYDLQDLKVHGGLIFSGFIDDSWWIGFDCAHSGDRIDYDLVEDEETRRVYKEIGLGNSGTTKDYQYVLGELERLTQQVDNYESVY